MVKPRAALLYLAPWVAPGGADRGTVDWFRYLDHGHFESHLITTARTSSNTFVHLLEPYAESVWNLPDLMSEADYASFVLSFVKERHVALIHIMNSHLGFDLIPSFKKYFPQTKIVVQHHAEEVDQSGYVRYVASRYGHLVDAYSATSRDLKRRLIGHGVHESSVRVIYTGIDATGEWAPRFERVPRLDGSPMRVLFAGRLEDQKDPLLMVQVAKALADRGLNAVIDVVGDGSLRRLTEEMVRAASLEDVVRFHGVSYDMLKWYENSDLLLMTSRFEGIPYVIYEAMAMGITCVVPDVNANTELLDQDHGFVVADRLDVSSYIDALECLDNDRELLFEMGLRCRDRVLEDYPIEEMARQHERLYDELLSPSKMALRQ
ncbi:MAG: glycosyltransferase family 4 protein [Acidimicrobiales bacterium]